MLFLLFLLPAWANAGEFTVVPGHSMGKIWLGATRATTHKILGKPYLMHHRGKFISEYWKIGRTAEGVPAGLAVIYERGRVVQLEATSPRFVTSQGISVSSNLGTIRKKLGRLRVVSFNANNPDPDVAEHATHYYDAVRYGIAFDLGMGSRPNLAADSVPGSIIVHRRGRRVLPSVD